MTQYEYECPDCGERELVTSKYLVAFGPPMCDCQDRRPMRRKYSVSVVWPKENRGH